MTVYVWCDEKVVDKRAILGMPVKIMPYVQSKRKCFRMVATYHTALNYQKNMLLDAWVRIFTVGTVPRHTGSKQEANGKQTETGSYIYMTTTSKVDTPHDNSHTCICKTVL